MKKPFKLIFILVLLIASASMASAQYISVSPQTSHENPGDSFTVTVEVNSTSHNLRSVRLDLFYNLTVLEVSDVEVENDLFGSSYLTEPGSGVDNGKIHYGIARTTTPTPASGTFLTIDFEVKSDASDGIYTLDLDGYLYDESGDSIPNETNDGFVVVGDISPSISNLSYSLGNFYVNYTWDSENCDSYNFTLPDGTWVNGTVNQFSNRSVGPHGWYNITVFGYNSLLGETSSLTNKVQIPNNPPVMENIADRVVDEGDTVYIDVNASDKDGDNLTYSCNSSNFVFDPSTGMGSWDTASGDAGTYYVGLGVSDGYGGIDNQTVKLTVIDVSPPADITNLQSDTGNFWINWTWENPQEDYNYTEVYIDGVFVELNTVGYYNGSYSPHATKEIGLRPVDPEGNEGNFTNQSTTIPNNPITIYNVSSRTFLETETLIIDAEYSDEDNDVGTFFTNATKGSINSDGQLLWNTGVDDGGTYTWNITVEDDYGSSDTAVFQVEVIDATPAQPANLQSETGNFYVNYSWDSGENTDSFNLSINGVWHNGTSDYFNQSTIPHGWVNLSLAAYNSSTKQLSPFVHESLQVPNNPVILMNVSSYYTLLEGETLYIDAQHSDEDGDTVTYGTNAQGDFNPDTGELVWNTQSGDEGTYNWYVNVSDGYSSDTKPFTVIVENSTVGSPTNLQSTTGNFWINWTWDKGNNSDYSLVYVNGSYETNRLQNWYNMSNLSPHTTMEITVREYNLTSDTYSTNLSQITTLPNNPILITNTSDWSGAEGETVYLDLDYVDLDGDVGTFSTNATRGTLDPSTGVFTWDTADGDQGTYHWNFSVSDGYGSSSYTAAVTVKDSTPSPPTNLQSITGNFFVNYTWDYGGNTDSFNLSFNGVWHNGTLNYWNESVGPHGWGNITVCGYNTTIREVGSCISDSTQLPNNPPQIEAIADRSVDEGQTVFIDVNATDLDSDTLTYSCNSTLFTFDAVTGEAEWTTQSGDAGTYFVDFGVSDGYSADNVTVKVTVEDKTPPESITQMENTTGETYINWTWMDPLDPDFDHVVIYIDGNYRDVVSKDVQFFNETGLLPGTEYTISTHTVDTSGNVNQTWVNDTARTSAVKPVANFTYAPKNLIVNQNVEFTSFSYDPDGSIVSYEWEFGDGNVTGTTKTSIKHTYSSGGSYNVSLTVVDNEGITNSFSKTVFVHEYGDFDGNCLIDLNDFQGFGTAYNTDCSSPNYNQIADLDNDCDVDFFDFMEFAAVYNTTVC